MKKALSCAVLFLAAISSASAITYNVSRSWGTAELTGTVDVAIGSYNITNAGLTPFSAFNLILKVNGSSLPALTLVDTSGINGTGLFNINATSSQLIFTAAGDSGNGADLVFKNAAGDRYAIGSDLTPQFEVAYTSAGDSSDINFTFPVVWATADRRGVPDSGSTALFLGLGILALAGLKRRLS